MTRCWQSPGMQARCRATWFWHMNGSVWTIVTLSVGLSALRTVGCIVYMECFPQFTINVYFPQQQQQHVVQGLGEGHTGEQIRSVPNGAEGRSRPSAAPFDCCS